MADNLGVVPQPQVPLVTVALIAASAVLVANVVAFLPGQLAPRTRPAVILRSE